MSHDASQPFSWRAIPWNSIALVLVLGISIFTLAHVILIEKRQNLSQKTESKFKVSNVYNSLMHNQDWEFIQNENRLAFVNALLTQPFQWLGKGQQVFAFLSQDGQYVIKFFQMHRMRDDMTLKKAFGMPDKKQEQRIADAQQRRKEIFESSKLAFLQLQEETGVVYAHLNKTHNMLRDVIVYDIQGVQHKINTDSTAFVIQRCARYIMPTLSDLMFMNRVDEAKQRINQIISLLTNCADKGMIDEDWALIRNNNLGFLDNSCIYIDSGHMIKDLDHDNNERLAYDLTVRVKPLHEWLKMNYPALTAHFEEQRATLLNGRGFGIDEWGNAYRIAESQSVAIAG